MKLSTDAAEPVPERDLRNRNSMVRGVEALTVLLKAHRSMGITQVAAELELPKSTTHDLLGALGELGFVDQDSVTRRYSVSPEIFRFVHLFSSDYGPNSAVKSIVRAEAAKLNANVIVTALCRHSTYALCASGPHAADTFMLGSNGPAHNSSCGKVLVAQLDELAWPDYAPKPDENPESVHSNLNPEKFFAELRFAKVSGVAWMLRERDGVSCSVAAPLTTGTRPWNRAVAIALPYAEWVVRDRDELAAQVKRVAVEISSRLKS